MFRIARSFALMLLAAFVALGVAVPAASAAPVSVWESVSLNMNTDTAAPLLIVSGKLPDSTALPATVELAVPAGAQLQWAGEILGGDPSKDPEATPTKTQRGAQDVYTFTIKTARVAQLEATAPSAMTVNGDTYTVDFAQPAWSDMPEAVVSIQIPQAAQLSETPTGTTTLVPGPTGFRYYQRQFTKVKAGDVLSVAFAYKLPAGAATGTPTGVPIGGTGGGGLIVPILLAGVAAALGVALVMGVRRKMNQIVDRPVDRAGRDSVAVEDDQSAEVASNVADTPEYELEPEPEPRAPRNRLALVGTLGVVGALLVAGVFAVSSGGAARSTGDTITKTLAGGEACTHASIGLTFPPGTDTAQAAEQLFAALASVPSITEATVKLSASSIDVGYCDSQADEGMIRQALAPTGYVVASSAPAPTGPANGSATASGTAD